MQTVIIAVLGSSVLSTLLSLIVSQYNRAQDNKSGTNEALKLVLKDRLRFLCNHYITQGYIYTDELRDVLEIYRCYHDTLHGNGYMDTLVEKVKALDVRGVEH